MAQTAMTVRLDSDVKTRFDSLCSEFGMSANTAFTIFVNAVIRSRKIPFTIEASSTTEQPATDALGIRDRAFMAVESMRDKTQGMPEMTLEEINEEIRLAREEHKKKVVL